MTWFGWMFLGYTLFGIMATIGMIGRPRKAIKPLDACVIVGISGLMMFGVLAVGTGHVR